MQRRQARWLDWHSSCLAFLSPSTKKIFRRCAEYEKKDRTGKDDAKLIQICNALQVSIEQGQKSFVDKASAIGATKAYAEQVFIFGTEGTLSLEREIGCVRAHPCS